MANTEIINLYQAIKDSLSDQYKDYTIEDFDLIEESIDVPAFVLNIVDFENDVEINETDTTRLTVRMELYICHSFNTENVNINLIQKAANVANFINNNTFDNKAYSALVITGEPDIIEGLDGVEVYKIDFEVYIDIIGKG